MRAWIHFPRAPEQFVASPLCLVGYVRWDARSDRVPPLQTIIFSSFTGRTKSCRPTGHKRNVVMGTRQKLALGALLLLDRPVQYPRFHAGPCHSIQRPIFWRAVLDYSDSFVCMRGRRGYRLRPRTPSIQPRKFALCSCREGSLYLRRGWGKALAQARSLLRVRRTT